MLDLNGKNIVISVAKRKWKLVIECSVYDKEEKIMPILKLTYCNTELYHDK